MLVLEKLCIASGNEDLGMILGWIIIVLTIEICMLAINNNAVNKYK